jgi:hypothetical protein
MSVRREKIRRIFVSAGAGQVLGDPVTAAMDILRYRLREWVSMLTVRQAAFRRVLEQGGETYAEVEVFTDNPRDPGLLAYFRAGSKDYQLVRVMKNEADTEVDWYDNNLHDALEDVTITMFSGPSHAGEDRNAFAERILVYDGIRETLERNLEPKHKS